MMKYFIFFVVLALMINSLYAVDETLVKIAEEANIAYYKPEVGISPTGDIYVAYQAENQASGGSEIYLSKYSSGRVSFVINLSNSSAYSYEPEIKIPNNGYIHAAWADQTGDTHVIKYRYFNGSTWSNTINLGQVGNSENIEDLRITVDESGNVFVVFMYWPAARCIFISKYGNNISFENFPLSGRSKHPDVAADPNYVHIVWQYKPGRDYTIAYSRRPNQRGSNWESWIDLEYYITQRPRMSLASSNSPHVVFFHKDENGSKRLFHKKKIGNRFSDVKIMSDPNRYENYHFCDISAVSEDNILVTMQRGGWAGGQYISYNWKRNGTWNGYSSFSKTNGLRPTKQSVDLADDRFFAAVAFCEKSDIVYLLLAEESGGPGGKAPTASFTFSPLGGHAPLDVTFDASASTDPDGQITNYNWNFGDTFTGTGQTILHRYETQGEYTVTLTVTDDDGKTDSTSHIIIVEPPNQPPVAHFTFSPTNGLYPLTVTFDASASTDVDGQIVQYEWDFDEEEISSGPVVTYIFREKGLYKITLTVYDDDDDSATASGTVEVLGLVSPLNIAYEAMINRNLFTIQNVYRITWESNPENAQRGANIVQYNIYRKRPDEGTYSFVAAVAAGETHEYYDRIGTVQEDFIYTVTAVDDQGRESDLPGVSVPSTIQFDRKLIKDIEK
jgi:PKD repeat protein